MTNLKTKKNRVIKAWAVVEKDGLLFKYKDCEMDIYTSRRAAKECDKKWQHLGRKVVPIEIVIKTPKK